MAETTKNPGDKLSVTPPGKSTLTLKPRTETGVVRQSFSHGRSKAVVVEKVKSSVIGKPKAETAPAPVAPPPPAPAKKAAPAAPAARTAPTAPSAPAAKPSGVVLRTLTDEERDRRA